MVTPGAHSNPGSPQDAVQFDLFAPSDREPPPPVSGINLSVARASVSPGWWSIAGSIYGALANDAMVRACREEDGVLLLDATVKADGRSVAPYVQRLGDLATRTCGRCGSTPASPYQMHVNGPTRVVCVACKARLQSGESYLTVADEFWRLDGSKRSPGVHARTDGGIGRAAPKSALRACTSLGPEELRNVIAEFRTALAAEIVGQDETVVRLAVLAGLHVDAGLPRSGLAR